jgi:hypothetical protein
MKVMRSITRLWRIAFLVALTGIALSMAGCLHYPTPGCNWSYSGIGYSVLYATNGTPLRISEEEAVRLGASLTQMGFETTKDDVPMNQKMVVKKRSLGPFASDLVTGYLYLDGTYWSSVRRDPPELYPGTQRLDTLVALHFDLLTKDGYSGPSEQEARRSAESRKSTDLNTTLGQVSRIFKVLNETYQIGIVMEDSTPRIHGACT